jgi:hypothetical protein
MKLRSLPAFFLLPVFVFSACLSGSRREAPLPGFPEEPVVSQGSGFKPMPQIQDHQGKAEGEAIPEWVSRYLTEGEGGVEEMPVYQGKYVFIGENQGLNPGALGQWQTAFSPPQDFAQLAAARIEARLTRGAGGSYPDNVYGPFFEAMVKKTRDAKYRGVQKADGFWVCLPQEASPAAAGEEGGEDGEAKGPVYVFLVFLSIDKPDFEAQFDGIFNSAKMNLSLTRSQEAAVNRVRENFFDGSF